MPKRKAEVETPTFPTRSRRAASKEALKQMQILLDDEAEESETLELPSDDDDDVVAVEVHQPPPKKKYKLSHRKSSDGNDRDVLVLKSISNNVNAENTLELDCWVEELSDTQKELRKKYDDECKALEEKIEAIIKNANCTTVHKTELSSAYDIEEPQPAPPPPAPPSSIILQNQGAIAGQSYQLVMDPRLGLIVAGALPTASSTQPPPLTTPSKQQSAFKGKVQISQAVKAVANATAQEDIPSPPTIGGRQTRMRSRTSNSPSTPLRTQPPVARTQTPVVRPQPPVTRPQPSVTKVQQPAITKTVLPKPTIQLTKTPTAPVTRQRAAPTPAPAAAPTLATATSRPTESNVEGGLAAGSSKRGAMVDLTDDRTQADTREIAFNKLQGKTYPSLVVVARPHIRVKDLNLDRGKLDTKVKSVLMHPPTKFTEWLIQQGLVRSEQRCSIHPTSQLKLGMYSDVSKFPYSGGYVWISECCPQRFVSVFSGSLFEGSPHPPVVILKLLYHWSCQTNIQNVTQWVKVDNLYVKGLYTWLRAICTVGIHTHIKQLGGPGIKVEVGVISLGTTSQDGNQRQVKVEVLGILETTTKFIRLRAVEPDVDKNYKRRFTKILEPVMHWVHPASIIITDLTVDKNTLVSMGFNNIVQSTSTEYGNSNRMIMEYLRQVVPRMFQNTLSLLSRQIIQQFLDELVWREWFGTTASQAFDNIIIHLAEQTRADVGSSLILRLNKVAANPFKGWALSNTTGLVTLTKTTTAVNSNVTVNATPDNSSKRYTRVRKPAPSPTVRAESPPPPRPAKSVSPDVPEQMVPLENYYYGTIDESDEQPSGTFTLNMKCPFCKMVLNNNIGLMHHLFKHAHNVSGDTKLCRYCLTGVPNNTDLMNHIATSHPSETKFDNGFACLICETQFMNPFILGKHMSRVHCPYELPYQCGTCTYRCSNHKQAVDHFYKIHSNGPAIQCPFCLKSTLLVSGNRQIVQNMNYFIQHLQKHQKKQVAKRCGKCNLWFIQKDLLKEHQAKMHVSQRGKGGLVPWTAPRNCVMVPKSKIDEVPDDELINYSSLHFSVTKNLICKECDMCLDSPKHLSSFENCANTNCQYSTCCANAMKKHISNCKVLNGLLPNEPLPYIMFCICGFSSNDGNVLARHLAICEKKSAYPSRASANKAMVKQSMLDVLGLVRKPEESQTSEEKTDKTSAKEESAPKEVPTPEADLLMEVDENSDTTNVSSRASKKRKNKEAVIELTDEEKGTEAKNKEAAGVSNDAVNSVEEDATEKKDSEEQESKVQLKAKEKSNKRKKHDTSKEKSETNETVVATRSKNKSVEINTVNSCPDSDELAEKTEGADMAKSKEQDSLLEEHKSKSKPEEDTCTNKDINETQDNKVSASEDTEKAQEVNDDCVDMNEVPNSTEEESENPEENEDVEKGITKKPLETDKERKNANSNISDDDIEINEVSGSAKEKANISTDAENAKTENIESERQEPQEKENIENEEINTSKGNVKNEVNEPSEVENESSEANAENEADESYEANVENEAGESSEANVENEADESSEVNLENEADELSEVNLENEADESSEVNLENEADESTEEENIKKRTGELAEIEKIKDEADESLEAENLEDERDEPTEIDNAEEEKSELDETESIENEKDETTEIENTEVEKEDATETENVEAEKDNLSETGIEENEISESSHELSKDNDCNEIETSINEDNEEVGNEEPLVNNKEDGSILSDEDGSIHSEEEDESREKRPSEVYQNCFESAVESSDSVVPQSVLDTLAAECANTAKSSLCHEGAEKMDIDVDVPQNNIENSLVVDGETAMDTD